MARVLVCSADPVGRAMAGPGIRCFHFARELAKRHDVTLVAPHTPETTGEAFEAVAAPPQFARFAARFDVVVAQRLPPGTMHQLARMGTRTIYDLYAPSLVEALAFLGAERVPAAAPRYREVVQVQRLALALGDAFLCASDRQRDLWLGALAATGRLDIAGYREDPSFGRLVAVVPFGVEERRPAPVRPALKGVVPGIEEDARVLLWGGGLWEWLDPFTVIRAVARLARTRDELRLYVPGGPPPGADARSAVAERARQLARDLGLEGRHVFFGDRWIPYAERDAYLLEADLGVSAHRDTVEARFAFRTRVLDYLWAEVPAVLTEGDVLAELVARRGAGLGVAPEDVSGWVEALDRLLGDAAAHEHARAAARDLRAQFEWPRIVEPLERLVADSPPPPHRTGRVLLARSYAAGVRTSLALRGVRGTAAAVSRRLLGRP